MAHLVAISGPSAGKRYELDMDKECVLGRSFNSDIYVGDLNVSRRHARILNAEGDHIVEDLGSGNGTFVNDKQVTRHTLSGRDVIRIGGSTFRYELDQKKPRWGQEVQTVIADLMHHAPPTADPLTTTLTAGLSLDPGAQQEALAAAAAAAAPAGEPDKSDSIPNLEHLSEGRAVKMLEAMYAVADVLGSEMQLDKLLEKILSHLFKVFPQADRGFVLMRNDKTGQLVPEAVMQRPGRQQQRSGGLSFSHTMVDQVMSQGPVIRGTQPTRPARPPGPSPLGFDLAAAEQSQNTPKIGAPLVVRDESLGTLHIEGRAGAPPFSPDDLALLSAIARQASLAIANARAGQQIATQQRLEADLQLARKIQQSFLPQHLPEVAGLKFQAHYLPALHVGGDFYDIIQLSPARIGILVGDISGKGVSAALLMAKVTSDIRLFSRSLESPAEILSAANRTLMESGQDAMFATVIYIMLDMTANTFTVSNAGHQPPMVCSSRFAGISELDDATAVALGVVPEMEYPQEVYELVPGDVVMVYTDGINEAMNRHKQEYNMQRLRNAVVSGPADPTQVVQRVVADVRRFVGNAAQSDDQTLVAFGVTNA